MAQTRHDLLLLAVLVQFNAISKMAAEMVLECDVLPTTLDAALEFVDEHKTWIDGEDCEHDHCGHDHSGDADDIEVAEGSPYTAPPPHWWLLAHYHWYADEDE